MKYKHDLTIKHMPYFVYGMFLLIVCGIASVGGGYVLFFTNDHNFGTVVLLCLNLMGLVLSITKFLPESLQYTATSIPDEDLSPADQLKQDI